MTKFRRVRIGSTVYRVRQNISWDLKNAAEEYAEKLRKQYRFDGWLCRAEIPRILVLREILDENYESQLRLLNKRLEDYKFQIYLERENPVSVRKVTASIEKTKSSIIELAAKLAFMDQFTLEGYTELEASRFVLRRSVSPRLTKYTDLLNLERALGDDIVHSEKIRELARTEPWRSIWNAKKQAAFRYQPLTSEQLSLCSFSRMYDGVYKHAERPDDYVIENDDMLDGWIISLNRKENRKDKVNQKIANSREVFVMAKDQVEANEVYSQNPADIRFIQKSRQKQLERQGSVRYADFGDVKRERLLQNAQKQG